MKTLTLPHGDKPKLAVFDVEGVLIPRNRLFFDAAKKLGFVRLLGVLFFGFLYEAGITPLKYALTKIFQIMKGAPADLFVQVLDNLPFTPDAPKTFAVLKARGYKTALVSSGLPTFLVEKLAKTVNADYAVGIEVGIRNGVLTGDVWGDVTERNGKFLVLKELMEAEHVSPADCVVVADDRNNASILLKEALKIGYNPDFIIRIKADWVATGKLAKILPLINGEHIPKRFPSHKDLLREFIHSSGIFIPVLAILFGVLPIAIFIVVVVAVYCVSELARIRGRNLPFFSQVTRYAASQSELCEFASAPVYFAAGILLTLVLFPAPASYAGIAIFTLGDSTASLFGGTLSKKPLPFNRAKTLEGSLVGFFFAFLAGTLFISPWLALAGAAIGMFIEYLPLPINDNLLIPVFTGLALTFLI